MAETYPGTCFCGAVAIEASGAPADMGYCHCNSCRSWAGAPLNAFTLWPAANVKVTRGEDQLVTFSKTDFSHRQSCKRCGGHVKVNHPSLGLVDIPAAVLTTLAFKPNAHLNYAETVLPMKDGLPKFKDFPAAIPGGSGEMIAE